MIFFDAESLEMVQKGEAWGTLVAVALMETRTVQGLSQEYIGRAIRYSRQLIQAFEGRASPTWRRRRQDKLRCLVPLVPVWCPKFLRVAFLCLMLLLKMALYQGLLDGTIYE